MKLKPQFALTSIVFGTLFLFSAETGYSQELMFADTTGMISESDEFPSGDKITAALPPSLSEPEAPVAPSETPSLADLSVGELAAAEPSVDDLPASVAKEADWHNPRKRKSQSYIQADYLLWWAGDSKLPPLISTNPTGTAAGDVGTSSSTQSLYGNESVGDWPHSGLRLRLGRFITQSRISRMELDLWYLFQGSDDFTVSSSGGSPILSRPFFNSQTGTVDAQVISFPGESDGSFSSQYTRQAFGIDPSVFFCLRSSTCRWLELSTGYRFLWLQDELNLNERVTLEPGGLIAPGTGFDVTDNFTATNQFHLWTIGLSHSENHGNWLFNVRGNIGLGSVTHDVEIRGSTTSFIGNSITSTDDAGFLALQTNRGDHRESQFAWVPELNGNVKYRLGKNTTAHIGYTMLWLPEVVQAASHVPTTIDPRNLPVEQPGAGPDPVFKFVKDSLLVHGLNFGLRYDY